jgi:hypothetical protein
MPEIRLDEWKTAKDRFDNTFGYRKQREAMFEEKIEDSEV